MGSPTSLLKAQRDPNTAWHIPESRELVYRPGSFTHQQGAHENGLKMRSGVMGVFLTQEA